MKSITPKKSKKKIVLIVSACLLAAAVAAAIAYTIDQRNRQESITKYGSDTVNPSSDTPDANKSESSSSQSITSDKDNDDESNTTTTQPITSTPPETPIGTFVSNHQPNLDGSPRPSTITSTCTTSANVLCFIRFTKGQEIRTLPAQTTDGSGNTAWNNWNINSIGLGVGTWKIEAVARNGSVDTISVDPTSLQVEN